MKRETVQENISHDNANISRDEAVRFLSRNPAAFGRLVGLEQLGELHNRWIRAMLFGRGDLTLQAHRGSYKTSCVSVALAVICILYPRQKTLFLRKTDGDVREVLRQVQKILSHPACGVLVRAVWEVPLVLTAASGTELSTNLMRGILGMPQLVGMGMGGSLTGKHFDRIFTDDIVNLTDRYSPAEREQTKRIYRELQNVKNRGGRIVNTGTPWHPDDAFSLMPEPVKFDCYRTGLIGADELARIRSSLTPALFAANYELRHISDGRMFPEPAVGADEERVYGGICHLDAAYGGGDFTAFTVCRADTDGTVYLFGKVWQAHVNDVADEIVALQKHFRAGKLFCEDNGDKGYLASDLRRRGAHVSVYHESMNKDLKISLFLRGAWTHVVFCRGTDDAYLSQITDYPGGAHDDAPDSAASALRFSRGQGHGQGKTAAGNLWRQAGGGR